jgi:hypothetical protein
MGAMRKILAAAAMLASLSALAQQNTPIQAPYVAPVVGGAVISASNPLPISTSSAAPAPAKAGVSATGSVGTTSATIMTAGAFTGWVTIQNTSANILYVSFTSPATTSSTALAAGVSITLPFGPTNALFGIGSATATTFAVIGY